MCAVTSSHYIAYLMFPTSLEARHSASMYLRIAREQFSSFHVANVRGSWHHVAKDEQLLLLRRRGTMYLTGIRLQHETPMSTTRSLLYS